MSDQPALPAEKVRIVHRFQCVCPCGWESEELFDLIGDAAWRLEKHEAGACPLPLLNDGQANG